jgi:hypothetical protein
MYSLKQGSKNNKKMIKDFRNPLIGLLEERKKENNLKSNKG